MTLATPPRVHVRTVPGDVLVKFEVRTFNHIRAIGIYCPKNLDAHVTLATPPFRKFFEVSRLDSACGRACQI